MGAETKNGISVIDDIGRIITDSVSPEDTLDRIAGLIADKFNTDACSIYLLDADKKNLILKATVGLRKESVSKICMKRSEGLTGLVLEELRPVFVANPSRHPRFKLFKECGEEIYKTFLGVPLIYHKDVLGVLVVQTIRDDSLSESDIALFSAIASQISGAAAYALLLEDLGTKGDVSKRLSEPGKKKSGRKVKEGPLRGLPVSSGFAEGVAHYLGGAVKFSEIGYEKREDVEVEITRLQKALDLSERQVLQLTENIKGQLSSEDAAIFHTYLMFLHDESFKNRIIEKIKNKLSAEYALKEVILDYLDVFSRMEDSYLRERGSDVKDVGRRILRNLLGIGDDSVKTFEEDTILVAPDISPTELINLRQDSLKGIVMSGGGKTSHAVILARSFEIPMVIGVKEIFDTIKETERLIIDGTSGLVFDNPGKEIIDEYRRLKDEKAKHDERLSEIRNLPAKTKDNHTVMLGANIGLLSDIELVKKYGADYIGLYRTEFPFIVRKEFPTEEEQFALYKKIVEGAEGREVTIRTLDIGGDKFLSYLDYSGEDNPYLGWRSIRVSLELDDIFREQIRAVLRASAFGNVKLMFPMITSIGEVKKIILILSEEKNRLKRGGVRFDETIKAGIMIEVPAAVKILNKLLSYVDFVSIGTNDLIQYTLAVDRNNPKVASLYNPLHPAVITTVSEIVSVCKKNGKEVGICGEAVFNPKCAYLFLGMGIDRLSMNPSSIPLIKELIMKMKRSDGEVALKKVLDMEDEVEISDYLEEEMEDTIFM
ncbi:MAG: phosphoenolpyruvate--protein phosphotransferase [Proteobacteria bacterium]|nr:phosphoenolpyruvate--protein phosphotransferase [Pseudomonadota bacterium]